jgi:O-antigen ligase
VLGRGSHIRAVLAWSSSLPVIAAVFWFLVPHETLARLATIPEQLNRGDLNQRLNIWSAGWQAFRHAPFLGEGAGTFIQAAGLATGDTAHNTALTIAVEGGIIALVLASAILAVCARMVLATRGSMRIALSTAFLIWLITSLVATVEVNRTTWLLMGMLALAGRLGSEHPELMKVSFPNQSPDPSFAAAGEIA